MGHMKCDTKWQRQPDGGGLGFKATIRGHEFVMDTKKESGGQDEGPSPKEVLLASICACSGIDVASILQKMRVNLVSCDISAESDTTEGYPSVFDEIKLKFRIVGPDIKHDQATKAVALSMTKYCGVSAMVAGVSPITYEIFLNEKSIGTGRADFSQNLKPS
jgi:putative redox protein